MKIQIQIVRTGIDEITTALFQYPDGFCSGAVDLLHDELDILRLNTGLIHRTIFFRRLELRDLIVVIVSSSISSSSVIILWRRYQRGFGSTLRLLSIIKEVWRTT